MSKLNRYGTLAIILLMAIIVLGGRVVWSGYSPGQPIEISLPPAQTLQGKIFIGGAVNNAGFYPLKDGDSLEALIQAAGGTTGNASINELRLYIPSTGEASQSQKVDINRAEVWLLEALPGIGETLARRIIDYRQQNGPFLNTAEIMKVEGIGANTYEQIEHLITVAGD